MSRICTEGFEIELNASYNRDPTTMMAYLTSSGGVVSRDTTVFRSGVASGKFDSGSGGTGLAYSAWPATGTITHALGNKWSFRFYMNTTSAPASNISVCSGPSPTATNTCVAWLTNGTLQLYANGFRGSASPAVNDGQWHRVEFQLTWFDASTGVDGAELRVDGVSYGSVTGLAGNAAQASTFYLGFPGTPGASKVMWLDDLGWNDHNGTSQNTWLGEGKVVLLKPINPDAARGANWVAGAGGTTNLWDAVDNIPPAGAVTGTNTSQIHNVTKDTTGNYDATLTTYTTAGIGASDTITLVRGMWCMSGLAAANSAAGNIVSNPAAAAETLLGSPVAAPGAYPTNWFWYQPTAQIVYAPTVTNGTSPVLRIGKRLNSTTEVACCFMGLTVEYVATVVTPKSLVANPRQGQQLRQRNTWH